MGLTKAPLPVRAGEGDGNSQVEELGFHARGNDVNQISQNDLANHTIGWLYQSIRNVRSPSVGADFRRRVLNPKHFRSAERIRQRGHNIAVRFRRRDADGCDRKPESSPKKLGRRNLTRSRGNVLTSP